MTYCVCASLPMLARYIAGALLDSTIEIFFTGTLKVFVSLYGHNLPVLPMDISSDGALLASGSADQNVKIWGMDLGDCWKISLCSRRKEKRGWRPCLRQQIIIEIDEGPELGMEVEVGSKRTQETPSATGSIIEAVDIADSEIERILHLH